MNAFTVQDVETIEQGCESEMDIAIALQRAINGGMWGLQGSYGRSMMAAITAGDCMLGSSPSGDYWGNPIPSRQQVMAGTKGSREYVVAARGEQWAKMLEAA